MFSFIKKPVLIIIYDHTCEKDVPITEIDKFNYHIGWFIYILQRLPNMQIKLNGIQLRSGLSTTSDLPGSILFQQNELIIFSLHCKIDINQLNKFINIIKNLQKQDQQIIQIFKSTKQQYNYIQKNIQLDLLFINIYRIYHKQYLQIINIINQLFNKKQLDYIKKQQDQKKYIQYCQNKNPQSHYPQKMKQSKSCKRCQNTFRKKYKKTNIKCQGCSVNFKKDIALCPQCFAQFHQKLQFYSVRMQNIKSYKKIKNKRIHHYNIKQQSVNNIHNQPSTKKTQRSKKCTQKLFTKLYIQKSPTPPNKPLIQKIKKLNHLLNQTFQMTQKLSQIGYSNLAIYFLKTFSSIYFQNLPKFNLNQSPSNQFTQLIKLSLNVQNIINPNFNHLQSNYFISNIFQHDYNNLPFLDFSVKQQDKLF